MKKYFSLASLAVMTLTLLLASVSAQAASDKFRIKFNHEAKQRGELVLQLTPAKGKPIKIKVEFRDGKNENRAANKTEMALKRELDRGDYHVERDNFEDVVVKAKRGTDKFDLKILSNTAKGLDVKIKKG